MMGRRQEQTGNLVRRLQQHTRQELMVMVGIKLSQLGIILSLGVHLAKSGDIFDCHDLEEWY